MAPVSLPFLQKPLKCISLLQCGAEVFHKWELWKVVGPSGGETQWKEVSSPGVVLEGDVGTPAHPPHFFVSQKPSSEQLSLLYILQ